MSILDATRAELGLLVLYLNKAESRDKICRAIQYGSKFLSDGQPGTALNVDRSNTLARKVFHLFKFKNALLSTFLFLDQFVWIGRSGIVQLGEIGRLYASMKKLEKELKNNNKYDVLVLHSFFFFPRGFALLGIVTAVSSI
ncbi:hypothetical protein K1719_015945 [Acacia pycnantha]|nr:hypothetical protein K1719_015945 [Acacia pycnantha]